jgi:hypothetical protein
MNKTCFVIMPIGDQLADRNKFDIWLEIYEDIIVPAVTKADPSIRCIRADELKITGSIIRDIVSYLFDSELVIADLTDKNPNVFYELGVRDAVGKPSILIAQHIEDIPFDLRSYRTLLYGTNQRAARKFQADLEKVISNIFTEGS